jgi:hypothetical protein
VYHLGKGIAENLAVGEIYLIFLKEPAAGLAWIFSRLYFDHLEDAQ